MAPCCRDCFEWLVSFAINVDNHDSYGSQNSTNKEEQEEESSGGFENILKGYTGEIKPLSMFKKQLFNRHGYNLAVFPGGIVKGVREAFNPHAVLHILTVGIGEIIIQGLESGTFIAMDSTGKVYGEEDPRDDRVRFMEHVHGNYVTYLNKKYAHMGWYLALKQSGSPKRGELTSYPWPQKAILFTYRDPYPKSIPAIQLRNQHGYLLRLKDLKVTGTRDTNDECSIFELLPGNDEGVFRIHCIENDSYIAMGRDGNLYGHKDSSNPDTLFIQHSHERFFEYLSHRWAHSGWYLAIKKNGLTKKGKKTFFPPHQNAILFEHLDPSVRENP
ncbi:uncharacterized protein [Lepeophtheirus salmonis]|nr:uncharacterized protein LOC121128130 [Lepeophtheirus salmonis]